jgi:serine protease
MKKLLILALLSLGLVLYSFQGLANQGEFDSLVLDFREDIPQTEIQTEVETIAQRYNLQPQLNSIYSLTDNVYVVRGDKELLRTLRQESKLRKDTEYIEPNYIYHSFDAPNDPDYVKQWNLRSINVEQAWSDSKGTGITVAVIDTGVTKVADLGKTKFLKGYDFVNDKVDATDDVGHGTHVAGTIAQSTNNAYGVAGIAYEANIMPIKVLSAQGGGTVADIAEAIRFAADNNADVINLSLGGAGESKLMQEAIDYAYNKDVVVVAAAGNANQNAASYPARYPHAIGVSALDAAGQKAAYSNFGAGVDISAPGGGEGGKILQHTINPETGEAVFLEFQGTSMAAPHVAGVAALVKAAGITEPAEVLQVLKQSVRKVAEDPLNHFGAGQLDAGSAVKLALQGQITFQDFFRWLRDNGYLNPRFWIDGGTIALLPKVAMVLGSYLLAFILRNYLPFWSGSLFTGIVTGSSGLFFLKGFYIFDLPQYPFRILGSSIPELGNAISGTLALNPLFASILIPLVLIALFLGHPQWKWVAIGSALGVASCLGVYTVIDPQVWGLGSGWLARMFLLGNACACFGLAYLASQGEKKTA